MAIATDHAVVFRLTCHHSPAWDSKWSGDEELHLKLDKMIPTDLIYTVVKNSPYFYCHDDGWIMKIEALWVSFSDVGILNKAKPHGLGTYTRAIDLIIGGKYDHRSILQSN